VRIEVRLLALLLLPTALLAQSPLPTVRPIPPPGIHVPDADRAELQAGVTALGKEIAALDQELQGKPELRALLPDVQIFHKAVDWALRYNEFFDPKHIVAAKNQLALGTQRAKELRDGKPSWNSATGLVVRGYVSEIDGSVQPYGLVIPEGWTPLDPIPRRLDVWFRGRSEKGTELPFLEDRMKNKGEFAPEGVIVLHPFGRYCNANKFAGETDFFEALTAVRRHYRTNENRRVVRGFSMGGAAAWQFATHHPGMWAAAAPGAGFAETAEFFKSFAPGKEPPPWWEQVLWRWYDATTMAANLANVPTIAYSGEIDAQKQAADIMLRFAEEEGLSFPHIIGPQTAHKYHPEAKAEIEEFLTGAVQHVPLPMRERFVTYSLIYPRGKGVRITGMEKQWERAEIAVTRDVTAALAITTRNVRSFVLSPLGDRGLPREVSVDRAVFPIARGSSATNFVKTAGEWRVTERADDVAPFVGTAQKRPGLCGPIDHAFMSRFLFVRPTGKPLNAEVDAWAKSEMEHAQKFWRQVFRGDARVKDDTAITEDDIRNANLVLWGDSSSNAVLQRILNHAAKVNTGPPFPIQWSKDALSLSAQRYDSAHHSPALIFPNPLNPSKYVVLNSGPTFREQALLNNSDQTPKLPDWAIIDIRTPPGPKWPGLVVDAGFFDEQWQLPATR